jgi:hypothetical protein
MTESLAARKRFVATLILINKIAGPTGRSCTRPKQNALVRDFVERLERGGLSDLGFHFEPISPEAREAVEEARGLGFVEEVSIYRDLFFQDHRLLNQILKEAESELFSRAEIDLIKGAAHETDLAFMSGQIGADQEVQAAQA